MSGMLLALTEGERIAIISGTFTVAATLTGLLVSIVKLIRDNNAGHNGVISKLDGLTERFDRHIEWHVGKAEAYEHLDLRNPQAESNLGRSSHSEAPRSFVPHRSSQPGTA